MQQALQPRPGISVRAKILLVALLPLLFFSILGGKLLRESLQTRQSARALTRNSACFQSISELVTEIQRERGRTSMFLTGKLSQSELDEQRQKSDLAMANFLSALPTSTLDPEQRESFGATPVALAPLRQEIGTTIVEPAAAIARYSEKVGILLRAMSALANQSHPQGLGTVFTSLLLLETAKESAGILRARISGILGANKPVAEKQLTTLLQLKGRMDASLDTKTLTLSPEALATIEKLPARPNWQELNRVIELVVGKARGGDYGLNSSEFWPVVTAVIDDLGLIVKEGLAQTQEKVRLLEQQQTELLWRTSLAIALAFLLALAFSLAMAQRIVRPIQHAAAMLRDIADGEGDLTKRLTVSSGDEIGEMAGYFNNFIGKLQELICQIAADAFSLNRSAIELDGISAQVAASVKELAQKAELVTAATQESSHHTLSVAAGMEQASSNLSSVAAATEEMSSTIAEIAANSERARASSSAAETQATSVSTMMRQLGQAAEEIGEVTETITYISSQTNLLALNATIEAARAGSAGKAFTVVANSIKELARQTETSSEEIKGKIKGVQHSAESAIGDIGKIGGVIEEVGELVTGIAAAIEEQAAVTHDVAANISQASTGVTTANQQVAQIAHASQQISQDIAGVTAAVADLKRGGDQVNASAAGLSQLSTKIGNLLGRFRTE